VENAVRKQKTYSLPTVWADWLKKVYEENKDTLEVIDINSETELLKVLARLGLPRLQVLLQSLGAETESSSGQRGKPESADIDRMRRLQNPPTQP